MPTDARIALLIVGIILLAVAVIGAAVAATRKNSLRSSHIQRAVVAVVGAALIVWAATLWPPREPHPPAAGVPAPAAAAANAGARNAAPNAAPGHPDLVFLADSVFDACVAPTRPANAPDGATATLMQMQASQAATKAFDAATDAYQKCLSTAAETFLRQYGRGMSQANLQTVDALHTRINNAAVDADQSVADRFNQQLRIFKARSGSSAAR
jgi:hypothetical protein